MQKFLPAPRPRGKIPRRHFLTPLSCRWPINPISPVQLPKDIASASRRYGYTYAAIPEVGAKPARLISCWRPGDDGGKPLVLIGHGTGNDRFYPLRGLIEAAMARGFPVAAIDLPGHGRDHSDLFTIAGLQNCWPRVWETLAGQGFTAICTVGHSLGGAMIADALARHGRPQGLEAAVLVSPPLQLAIGSQAIANELLYSVDKDVLAATASYGVWGILPALGPFKRRRFPIRLEGNLSYVEVVEQFLTELRQQLTRSNPSAPNSLVICGEKDAIATATDGQRYAAWLQGDLQVILRANHFALPFKQSCIFAIMAFCEQLTDTKSA